MERQQNDRSPLHLSDEELEFYGNLYLEWKIGDAGVDFKTFLGNPDYYLRKHSKGQWRPDCDDTEDAPKGDLCYVRLRPAARTPSN